MSEARDVGETAVHFASSRHENGSVAIRRTGDYSVDYFLTPPWRPWPRTSSRCRRNT